MLHEPEFESVNDEPDTAEAAPQSRRAGKIFRGVFYTAVIAVLGLAVGVNASPKFAETVGSSIPAPVAAAMSSISGVDMNAAGLEDGPCCSSMSRASLMTASEDGSTEGMCPMEKAAMMAAAAEGAAGCCSSSMTSGALASSEAGCSGVCPLSGASEEAVLADATTNSDDEAAISLPAPPVESEIEEEHSEAIEVELPNEDAAKVEAVKITI